MIEPRSPAVEPDFASRLTGPRRRLFRFAVEQWPSAVGALAGLAAVAAAQLSLTWLFKLWMEDLLGARAVLEPAVALPIALALIGLLVVGIMASRYALRRFELRIQLRLRDLAATRLLEVSAAGIRRFASGDLMSRVLHDAAQVATLPSHVLRRVTDGLLVAGGAIVLMFVLDFRLALAAAVAVAPAAWIIGRFQQVLRRSSLAAHQAVGDLAALLGEQLAGATTVRLFGGRDFERRRFATRNREATRRLLSTELWAAGLASFVWVLSGLGMIAAIWYGTRQVENGAVSVSSLAAFCLYGAQIVEPLRRLGDLQAEIHRVAGPMARLFEICDQPPEASGDRRPVAARPAALSLAGVSFGYEPEVPVLRHVDFDLGAGDTVGVVATSGGGKSTLAALLVRLVEPDQGRILLDGTDLCRFDLDALRRSVVVVEQDSFLFAGSLRGNLLYGSWDASSRQLTEALRGAGLERWIDTLPRGLDTEIQEIGRSLSGGQRQRIALARAILREPRLLVLDEATSALDGETEARIFERLEAWLSRRSVVVMAHRLSTVVRLPRVITLAGGEVVADGPPRDLLGDSAPFRDLFLDQLEVLRPSLDRRFQEAG